MHEQKRKMQTDMGQVAAYMLSWGEEHNPVFSVEEHHYIYLDANVT